MTVKNDQYRIERALEICNQIITFMDSGDIVPSEIQGSLKNQWMVSTPLFNLGEQMNAVSSDFAQRHPSVPWKAIAGMRHRLVHDYEGTSWDIVESVLTDELRPLRDSLRAIYQEEFFN